jgi:hypothetical protein
MDWDASIKAIAPQIVKIETLRGKAPDQPTPVGLRRGSQIFPLQTIDLVGR